MTTAPGDSFSSSAPRLAAVLDLFGYTEDERLTVCHQTAGDADFTGWNVPAAVAEDEARRWADTCDVWFSVNPVKTPSDYRGRGTAAHVTRWAGVYADLDVKPGGLPSLAAARAVIGAVSEMLEQRPVAVMHSGHGLQPLWALDPKDEATDLAGNPARLPEARAFMRRFGRLVAHAATTLVAEEHRGDVDTVFDLARVLRVPGTVNRKPNPETGEPAEAPTSVELPGGSPLSVQEIADQLDAYGVLGLAGDRDGLGEIVFDPSGWGWAAGDCPYAVKTISAWARAEPRRGRHPWLIDCATRLAAMHRWGCLTGPLHRRAVETLTRRMAELCGQGIGGHVRSLAAGEIADALTWGAGEGGEQGRRGVAGRAGRRRWA